MQYFRKTKYSFLILAMLVPMQAISVDWYFYKNGIKPVNGNVYANGIFVKDEFKIFEIDGHNVQCGLTEENAANLGNGLTFQRKLFCLIPSDTDTPTAVSIFIECTRKDFFVVQQLQIETKGKNEIIPSVVCTNGE